MKGTLEGANLSFHLMRSFHESRRREMKVGMEREMEGRQIATTEGMNRTGGKERQGKEREGGKGK